ncbi:cytochrome P450 [Scandinavium manionii]|uniref:cytochrome P450 n=1 Tax=Scandinavium manionii TaxID=2926520 RepID=UPI002165B590|nr:cytochrome P450 [Scandinavium manionii]MCS2166127.1 cytochrome P450 [Scandinavium manionii]
MLARPLGENVKLNELLSDPYPIYARLREAEPISWVPAAQRYLVTRYDDIVTLERDKENFKADEDGSLMKRVMGHTMIRKDGAQHMRERMACEPSLKPLVIKNYWLPQFHQIVAETIAEIKEKESADLFSEFASPVASRVLAVLLGLTNVAAENLAIWSQAMMDGTGNYANDPQVWQRAQAASHAVDEAVDAIIPWLRAHPDPSLISSMLHADNPLSRDEIVANVKVIIGGGLNEPRDAMLTAVVGLLENPAQLADVKANPELWRSVFEETIRWVAPIGMYPRQTIREVELGGMLLPAGAKLGVVLASGNRDERIFTAADRFDIHREKKPHVAFGGGAHYCLGAWAARALVGQIALPALFGQLPQLAFSRAPQWFGWVFRGPVSVAVTWKL